MKLKSTVLLAAFVVTMGLLPGASAAQALEPEVIFDPENDRKVIEIRNLEIGGANYNVTFPEQATAEEVYDPAPGEYDFSDQFLADAAVNTVVLALNQEDPVPLYVGSEGGDATEFNQYFAVGYAFIPEQFIFPDKVNTSTGYFTQDRWARGPSNEKFTYHDERITYADFTAVPPCVSNADCDDGEYCNGEETCFEGICQIGTYPCEWDVEDCNEETDSCDPKPQSCAGDLNNDGAVDVDDFEILLQDWGRTDCPIQ